MLAFTRSVFGSESTDSLFKDIFTWHTAPERQTGFYISRNLQQQRLLTVVPPQGQTSTLRPLSTILFGLVHSHVLQWEKQGNQKEVRPCKKKEIKYLTFTSAQLSVRVCVFYFIPVLSMCRLSGTQQARRCWSWSSRRGGWGTSSAGPCSPPSHLRFEKWDTSCGGRGVMRRRRRRKAWLLIKILINSTL